jgi:hypothetical protein
MKNLNQSSVTVVYDLSAPPIKFEYDIGSQLYSISHGNWSELLGRTEFYERLAAEELRAARESFVQVLRDEVEFRDQAHEVD